jgi:hypothetical protein
MGTLVGAKHPSDYGDFLIKPGRKIYSELIEKEWSNIQRINLFGTFQFSPSTSKIDIESLVVRYADPTYWHKATQGEGEATLD